MFFRIMLALYFSLFEETQAAPHSECLSQKPLTEDNSALLQMLGFQEGVEFLFISTHLHVHVAIP